MKGKGMIVAVSQRVVEVPSRRESRDCLDQQWSCWMQSLGLVPVPVPNRLVAPADFLEQIRPQGIILSGGNNIAAAAYDGADPAAPVTDAYPERDLTEAALVEHAVRRGLPVLGCCRGMQFLQVHFGGRLTRLAGKGVKHVACTHEVTFVDDAVRAMAGRDTLEVNSFHDFGIAAGGLADVFRSLAISAGDQTVEALVHRSLPIAGIMWHPERANPGAAFDRALASALFSKQWPLVKPCEPATEP